jgi:hypothetical protein
LRHGERQLRALDSVNPLGPERFVVRAVNRAVNKVSEKNIEAIERVA